MTTVDEAVEVMQMAKREILELRAALELTFPYLCEMPAEVETRIREVLGVPR